LSTQASIIWTLRQLLSVLLSRCSSSIHVACQPWEQSEGSNSMKNHDCRQWWSNLHSSTMLIKRLSLMFFLACLNFLRRVYDKCQTTNARSMW
jgi:hypothetical protein